MSPETAILTSARKLDDSPYHLVLLAKDLSGYKNLIKLTTDRPSSMVFIINRESISNFWKNIIEGLIGLSACLAGEISRHYLNNDPAKAEEMALRIRRFWVRAIIILRSSIIRPLPKQGEVNEKIIALGKKLGIPSRCHLRFPLSEFRRRLCPGRIALHSDEKNSGRYRPAVVCWGKIFP